MGENGRVGASGRGVRVFCALLVGAIASLGLAVPAISQEDRPLEPQVVGGEGVRNGEYPFMVSMQSNRVQTTRGHFCGATLIDEDSILTAAHCADIIGAQDTKLKLGYEGIRIVVGKTVLTGSGGEVRRIARLSDVQIHPRYRDSSASYDAAVIDLDRPVSDGISPIDLATAEQNDLEKPGSKSRIAGWGSTIRQNPQGTNPANTTDRMREAKVPVVSDARARQVYAGKSPYVSSIMIAAGEDGTDTCQGDSGGPLFKYTGSGFVQTGITSTGIGCATKQYPGIYTEVNAPSIRNFITGAAN